LPMRMPQPGRSATVNLRTNTARRARAWGAIALLVCACGAQAQYPARPLKMIVPFPPGGSTDILARALATKLSTDLSQPVWIDTRPAAGGPSRAEAAARAAPDGFTIMMGHLGTLAVNVGIYKNLPY